MAALARKPYADATRHRDAQQIAGGDLRHAETSRTGVGPGCLFRTRAPPTDTMRMGATVPIPAPAGSNLRCALLAPRPHRVSFGLRQVPATIRIRLPPHNASSKLCHEISPHPATPCTRSPAASRPSSTPRPAASSRRRASTGADRQHLCRARRHRRRAHGEPDRPHRRSASHHPRAAPHARRRLRLGPLQAQEPGAEPDRV